MLSIVQVEYSFLLSNFAPGSVFPRTCASEKHFAVRARAAAGGDKVPLGCACAALRPCAWRTGFSPGALPGEKIFFDDKRERFSSKKSRYTYSVYRLKVARCGASLFAFCPGPGGLARRTVFSTKSAQIILCILTKETTTCTIKKQEIDANCRPGGAAGGRVQIGPPGRGNESRQMLFCWN